MPSKNDRIVGSVLRDLRNRAGMTRDEFAQKVDTIPLVVQEIEEGVRPLELREIFEYSEALDMSAHDVLSAVAACVQEATPVDMSHRT